MYKDSMQSRMHILHKVHTMKYTEIRNKKQSMEYELCMSVRRSVLF